MEKELDNAGPNPSPTSLTTLANPCTASGPAFNASVPPAITVVKTVVTPTAAAGAATFFKRLVCNIKVVYSSSHVESTGHPRLSIT